MTQITQTFISDNGETYYKGVHPFQGEIRYSFSDDFEDYWTEDDHAPEQVTRLESIFHETVSGQMGFSEAREAIDKEGLAFILDENAHACDMSPKSVTAALVAFWS